MSKVLFLLLGCFFIFSSNVKALVYLEPLIGVEKLIVDNMGSDTTEVEVAFGGRVGGSYLGFIAGGEITRAGEWTRTSLFVAYGLPIIPLRFFGRYFIDLGDMEENVDSPSGIGAGASFTGFPFVSINLDINKYALETDIMYDGEAIDFSGMEFMLSVSMPFDFL